MRLTTTLLGAFLAILLVVSVSAQERAPLYGELSLGAMTDDQFGSLSAAYRVGLTIPLDSDKGLLVRTLYKKAGWGPLASKSMQVSGLLSWYAGRKWEFFVVVGVDAWLSADRTGSDWLGGIGAARRIFTDQRPGFIVPFTVDLCFDISTNDLEGSNVTQLNLGLRFARPIKEKIE